MVTSPSALLHEAHKAIAPRIPTPTLGLILGSGLGHLAEQIEESVRIPYVDIPHMPVPTVQGHGGELIVGRLGGTQVACLSGRVHLYEGHEPERVVFGARLLALLGARAVLLTNAAGGISPDCTPGRLLLLSDHLNLTGKNPLLGPNDERLGTRFPDMSAAYDPKLRDLTRALARELEIPLAEGVYAGLLGPNYETPAEIRMLEICGASCVGMSTVHEVLALRHMGVRTLAISCITNHAAGKGHEELRHEEVAEVAAQARDSFSRLILAFCERAPVHLAPTD